MKSLLVSFLLMMVATPVLAEVAYGPEHYVGKLRDGVDSDTCESELRSYGVDDVSELNDSNLMILADQEHIDFIASLIASEEDFCLVGLQPAE